MEDEVEEKKITEFLELKEISGGKSNLIIDGGAKKIDIKGGSHILKITSHVEDLHIFGGFRELNIKSEVGNITIHGGISKIYIHNFKDTKVNKIDIIGGNHELIIYSFLNELNIRGGITKVTCNYENSKINKINTIGGKREFFLNPNTEKAEQINEGGTCDIHKTDIIPEEIWYQDSLSDNEIPITIITEQKMDKPCSICLNEFKNGEEVYFLPCIHCYHKLCLRQWVKEHKTCPTCKFRLNNKLASDSQ